MKVGCVDDNDDDDDEGHMSPRKRDLIVALFKESKYSFRAIETWLNGSEQYVSIFQIFWLVLSNPSGCRM